jgi:hypothetical protein
MRRAHGAPRWAAIGVLAGFFLLGLAGCQAGKTGAAAFPAASAPAASGPVAPLSNAALAQRVKPFLDCAFAAYVRSGAGRKAFDSGAAQAACDACSPLLEPLREFAYERTSDRDFVADMTGVATAHAMRVMQEASARAR